MACAVVIKVKTEHAVEFLAVVLVTLKAGGGAETGYRAAERIIVRLLHFRAKAAVVLHHRAHVALMVALVKIKLAGKWLVGGAVYAEGVIAAGKIVAIPLAVMLKPRRDVDRGVLYGIYVLARVVGHKICRLADG